MPSQHEARREVLRFLSFLLALPPRHAFVFLFALPVRQRHSRDRLPAHFDTVELVRDHIKHTYDLCLYERKKIADGWVTATNLLISLVILLVTVVWWLESFPR